MNLNSFYEVNKSFDNLIEKKLNYVFKKYKIKIRQLLDSKIFKK